MRSARNSGQTPLEATIFLASNLTSTLCVLQFSLHKCGKIFKLKLLVPLVECILIISTVVMTSPKGQRSRQKRKYPVVEAIELSS